MPDPTPIWPLLHDAIRCKRLDVAMGICVAEMLRGDDTSVFNAGLDMAEHCLFYLKGARTRVGESTELNQAIDALVDWCQQAE